RLGKQERGKRRGKGRNMGRNLFAGVIAAALIGAPAMAQPQAAERPDMTPDERREALGNSIMRHEGQLGALAPENLNKERPAPPFDLTGTWFVDLSPAEGGFSAFMFGSQGYPEFIGQAKLDFEEGQRARAEGRPYRDAIGQCFP